ncbi:MAG: flagellar biosynthesis protein FlhA [Myxococcales bacterium]|nr:flagellar biosynthesis protein FlhA [Myxococcales bacterium]
MSTPATSPRKGIINFSELLVGGGFLGIVALLILPLPPTGLDLFLALSMALATVVFLTALFSERPIDFSVFPTLLLITTLLRLALNVASTRLILLRGHEGDDAAGDVIQAFGDFVVGGNAGVGIIVFIILVLINFVVITKGAGRIAEVAARFTLDAMPGKQMAIDAELNAGTINDAEARRRRGEIEEQADFYGAMDGASKFVRGDAIAGLVITAINLVGGIAIGLAQKDMSFSSAAATYSMLTIGDGLVSQMPALVVSTSAGVVISRASGRSSFGAEVAEQLLAGRPVLIISSIFLMVLGLVPGLPIMPFGILSAFLLIAALRKHKTVKLEADAAVTEELDRGPPPEPHISELLRVDTLTLEVGYGLLQLVDTSRGGDIPERVKKLRRQLAEELGIIVPPVRVIDNLELQSGEYVVKIYGARLAKGKVMPERHMAIDSAGIQTFTNGIQVKEPVFNLNAFWIVPEDRARAESRGLTVVDPSTVMVTHLAEVLRRNAAELIGRDQVDELVSYMRESAPKLVSELIPDQMSLGELVVILQRLLEERISVRNLRLILEAISAGIHKTKEPGILTEIVRASLSRQITSSVTDTDGIVHAITLDRDSEIMLRNSLSPTGVLAPEPMVFRNLVQTVADHFQKIGDSGNTACLLSAEDLRRPLYELLNLHLPDLSVVALRELDRTSELRIQGTISGLDA